MKPYQKTLLYFIAYFLLFQIFVQYFVKPETVYNDRVVYDLIKDNPMNIEAPIRQIAKTIKKNQLKNYIIVIGDSVGYGTPCPPDQIISTYLENSIEKNGKTVPVFNLSIPANQTGDIYTIMLKMREQQISLDHLIINITYAGFVERTPDPSPVFWFSRELERLDKSSYQEFESLIKQNQSQKPNVFQANLFPLKNLIYKQLPIMIYKDYIKEQLLGGIKNKPQEPLQPWYEKDFLKDLIKQYEYSKGFSDKPFDMTHRNPQVYFLDKIMDMQKDKETLFFLAGANKALLDTFVTDGYLENVNRINNYFGENKGKYFDYIDFNDKIDNPLYSDHVHLLPKGYELIADTIFLEIQDWTILR